MKLSIVILNYNVQHFLELCLRSVKKAIDSIEAEIIVVDNNSDDDSCTMVKSKFPEVILIENKENHGFSKGNNIGVNKATGEYLCVLNPDTVVAEDTFIQLIQYAESLSNFGIIGCKLIDGRGNYLPESKRNIPIVPVALKKMLGNSKDYYANHLKDSESGKVDVLVGAFMFMKTKTYAEVGRFDEDYFMYGEDIDLSYKVLNAGYQNYYYGNTSIIHFKGESTFKDAAYAKRFYGAMQLFYKKHFKSNFLFDTLVRLGIKLAHLKGNASKKNQQNPDQYYFISNKPSPELKSLMTKPLFIADKTEDIKHNSELIFDPETLNYKDIISTISNPILNSKATFKFLLKDSRIIIGSNDSVNRGEVIQF